MIRKTSFMFLCFVFTAGGMNKYLNLARFEWPYYSFFMLNQTLKYDDNDNLEIGNSLLRYHLLCLKKISYEKNELTVGCKNGNMFFQKPVSNLIDIATEQVMQKTAGLYTILIENKNFLIPKDWIYTCLYEDLALGITSKKEQCKKWLRITDSSEVVNKTVCRLYKLHEKDELLFSTKIPHSKILLEINAATIAKCFFDRKKTSFFIITNDGYLYRVPFNKLMYKTKNE